MGVGEPWAYGETNTSVPDSGLLGWRVQGATEGFSGGSWGKQDSELPRQVSGRGVWLGHILEQKGPTFEFQRRHPWAVLRALGHVVAQKGRSHPHRAVGGSGAVLSICPARSLDQAAASVLCLPLSQGSRAVRIVCKGCGPPWRLDSRSLPWGPALPVLWEEEGAHVRQSIPVAEQRVDTSGGYMEAETSAPPAARAAGQVTPGFKQPPLWTPVSKLPVLYFLSPRGVRGP